MGLARLLLLSTLACGGSQPAAQATALPRKTPTTGATRPAQPTPSAQPATQLVGQIDPTFGNGGNVTTDFGSSLEEAHGVVVQSGGTIVAAGTAGVDPNDILNADFGLVRYR